MKSGDTEDAFYPAVEPPGDWRPNSGLWCFAFRQCDLLVQGTEDAPSVPLLNSLADLGFDPVRTQHLGTLGDRSCVAVQLPPEAQPPAGGFFSALRPLDGRLDDKHFAIAGRAVQIVEWDRTHQFCGACGGLTEPVPGERAKTCPGCQLTTYPRLSPAVIVLIRRGNELLLARGPAFPSGFYGLVAGFVEPGESLEEAIRREIEEEVGIEVTDIRYFGSQPWPFPHSLMIAFTAEYVRGELQVAEHEIADAGWFSVDNLPSIPPKLSIARGLIDAFLDEVGSRESAVGRRQAADPARGL